MELLKLTILLLNCGGDDLIHSFIMEVTLVTITSIQCNLEWVHILE